MGVEFKESNFGYKRSAEKTSKLLELPIKLGVAKDKKEAQVVLLISAIVIFAIALFFITSGGHKNIRYEDVSLPPGQVIPK